MISAASRTGSVATCGYIERRSHRSVESAYEHGGIVRKDLAELISVELLNRPGFIEEVGVRVKPLSLPGIAAGCSARRYDISHRLQMGTVL